MNQRISNSAVYTCIKTPVSFSHSGFSLKVARQLPLNTPKNPPPQRDFFETPPKFHWFFANVNARSNLAGIIRVFGHVVRDLQRIHPTAARDVMRTTRVRSKVERSCACAPLTKTQVWDSGFFAHALFVPKTPNAMGFSGSVNGTTKNPGFLDFGFCQCKWAYWYLWYWTPGAVYPQALVMPWGIWWKVFCTAYILPKPKSVSNHSVIIWNFLQRVEISLHSLSMHITWCTFVWTSKFSDFFVNSL